MMNPLNWFRPSTPTPNFPGMIREASRATMRETDLLHANRLMAQALDDLRSLEALRIRDEEDQVAEVHEALMMAAPAWRMPKSKDAALRESAGVSAQGAYGDIELALQNVDWRREINTSWLEFSRWGIQQIMLISRLYWVKNPMIQRGINISGQYVFGRGVEISSPDEATNEAVKRFIEANQNIFSLTALMNLDARTYYDGNLFFACQTDQNTGEVSVKTIDALEIQEIVCDPDDTEKARFYRRQWVARTFDAQRGTWNNESRTAWYPALGYEPDAGERYATIGSYEVRWDIPILHRKDGAVAKWQFGLPKVYAALDWAKAQRRMLEAFATIRQSLAQISMKITTKGGQQALQGVKQQLSTTVGPSASLWDQNPTAVNGSVWAAGPGTTLEAFDTKGAGGDPGDCREYKLMVAMVFGLPESFFADMETSNLATATSLDRPTELMFMALQQRWRSVLAELVVYAVKQSAGAPSGVLRESLGTNRGMVIREARRVMDKKGKAIYQPNPSALEVMVEFPTIIEADVPAQVGAIVAAYMNGQGIDQKEAVRLLGQQVDIDNNEEVLEEQFPSEGPDAYDRNRTVQAKAMKDAALKAATAPAKLGDGKPVKDSRGEVKTLQEAVVRLSRAVQMLKAAEDDGNPTA